MRTALKLWLVASLMALVCGAVMFGAGLAEMASQVTKDVGVVLSIFEGRPGEIVFVFEENHASILQQVEIAIMLNRLYAEFGLRHIGLEGLMAPKVLDCSWAHRGEPYRPDQPITGREDVITQTLQDGEIASAEFMGLIYEDVAVHGIDDAALYAKTVAEEAWRAPYDYLYAIALAGMTRAQRSTWQTLYNQKLYDDAFRYALSTQAFCAARLALLEDQVEVISAEDMINMLDELKAQAAKVKADLSLFPAAVENLQALRGYLQVVSQRSDALAANMVALAQAHPGAPLAMTIGSMHTSRVVEKLKGAGLSVVVVRTYAQAEGITAGMLSPEAYRRKEQGLSVAPSGWLGALLEGRKKPPPRAEKPTYISQECMRELTQQLAEAAARMYDEGEDIGTQIYPKLNRWIQTVGGRFRELEKAGWKLAHIEVLPPASEKPNAKPDVNLHFEKPDGTLLIIYAELIPGEKSPKGFSILEERLYSAHGQLLKKEIPVQETKPGEIRTDEKACSTTAIRTAG